MPCETAVGLSFRWSCLVIRFRCPHLYNFPPSPRRLLLQVAHCHDSVVYVLAPLKYASVVGCSDSIVVLGAVGKVLLPYHECRSNNVSCWEGRLKSVSFYTDGRPQMLLSGQCLAVQLICSCALCCSLCAWSPASECSSLCRVRASASSTAASALFILAPTRGRSSLETITAFR